MKKHILSALMLLLSSVLLQASPAFPGKITVTQPDGTTLSIEIHGDEYLHWTTCGGTMVEPGPDGFYYIASFASDGTVVRSNERYTPTRAALSTEKVTPPLSAIQNAARLRTEALEDEYPCNSAISTGNRKFLVILVQFTDKQFTANGGGSSSQSKFNEFLNSDSFSDNGAIGSVHTYYYNNSLQAFNPTFDVYGPVTVSGTLSSYLGTNYGRTQGTGAPKLIVEACQSLDSTVDFSQYDNDGDGYVDNVSMIFAGYGAEEGASAIWSHKWVVDYTALTLDGKRIYSYNCSPELKGTSGTTMHGIGTFCHEFGHVIGLRDLYDTLNSSADKNDGLGQYSLMGSGNYNNNGCIPPCLTLEEKGVLGWLDMSSLPVLERKVKSYTLAPLYENGGYTSPTRNDNEYFVYEFRNGQKWDTGLTAGLVIYHVDKSSNMVGDYTAAERWANGTGSYAINGYSGHECYDRLDASSGQVPFGNSVTSFVEGGYTEPVEWAGNATGFNLGDISYTTSQATFTCNYDNDRTVSGYVRDRRGNAVSGATVTLGESSTSNSAVLTEGLLCASAQSSSTLATATTGSDGSYSITFDSFSNDFTLSAHKDGFLDCAGTFSLVSGSVTKNLTMAAAEEVLTKNNGKFYTHIGNSNNTFDSIMCAIFYPADSLTSIAGYFFKSMSIAVSDTTSDQSSHKVSVFIADDNGYILYKDVSSQITFNAISTIDLSAYKITVPDSTGLYIGYCSDKPKRKPLYIDNGQTISGGDYYTLDDLAWMTLSSTSISSTLKHNFIVSAEVANRLVTPATEAGINYPYREKLSYSVGDTFTLKSVISPGNEPSSTTWSVNGAAHSEGDTITFSEAGVYEITCTYIYPSEKKETLRMKIAVGD